ncbi:hypothetical protein [Streptomyces luteireticuli]|uniref:hypothetical protein n=1 Tax=Streptomyces luteireticuli TaxID=173858 RepID=UPI003556322A
MICASGLRRTTALLLTAAALAGPSAPGPLAAHPRGASARPAPRPVPPGPPPGAECHTLVRGSHATADCFNGNATPDRVQLHLRCARWWDPAMDTAPVIVGPTRHVTLAQRCWLTVREAWVSHAPG